MDNYVVASTGFLPYGMTDKCHFITKRENLTLEYLREIKPRYVFFPHWSWKVPDEITSEFECVCFHMTDLPYGRGGSPLQNLIEKGHEYTRITALQMVSEIDAGPIYSKVALALYGTAQEIYSRAYDRCAFLIRYIRDNEPTPVEQSGEVTHFKRRKPAESVLPYRFHKCYDHIRMLDAPTYPKAFIEYGDLRLEFTDASVNGDEVEARVRIKCLTS